MESTSKACLLESNIDFQILFEKVQQIDVRQLQIDRKMELAPNVVLKILTKNAMKQSRCEEFAVFAVIV